RPQAERPGEAIRRHFLGFDYLPSWRERVVDAVKHVPHQQPGVADHVAGAPDRVETGEIGIRDKAECPRRGALRDRWGGKAACRQRAGADCGFQERRSVHDVPLEYGVSRNPWSFCTLSTADGE